MKITQKQTIKYKTLKGGRGGKAPARAIRTGRGGRGARRVCKK